jgi:hypothetical protein
MVSATDVARAKRSIFSSSHRDIGPTACKECCNSPPNSLLRLRIGGWS